MRFGCGKIRTPAMLDFLLGPFNICLNDCACRADLVAEVRHLPGQRFEKIENYTAKMDDEKARLKLPIGKLSCACRS